MAAGDDSVKIPTTSMDLNEVEKCADRTISSNRQSGTESVSSSSSAKENAIYREKLRSKSRRLYQDDTPCIVKPKDVEQESTTAAKRLTCAEKVEVSEREAGNDDESVSAGTKRSLEDSGSSEDNVDDDQRSTLSDEEDYEDEGEPFSRPRDFILNHDLSDGQDLFPVRVWNDKDPDIKEPPKFEYITGLEDVDGYQRTPCVCQCRVECNTRCHCMGQPRKLGCTESAYDENTGLLMTPSSWEQPIIDRVQRSIWECSKRCPCGPLCYNRIVQFGPRYEFEVFYTGEEKGWGVRTRKGLPGGAFIGEYCGELKEDTAELNFYSADTWLHFGLSSVRLPEHQNKLPQSERGKKYYIDASKKANFTRFVNHSCSSNAVAIYVFYDDMNPDRGMHIGLFTTRKVPINGEITLNYGDEFWEAKMAVGQFCACGSTRCRFKSSKAQLKKPTARKPKKVSASPLSKPVLVEERKRMTGVNTSKR